MVSAPGAVAQDWRALAPALRACLVGAGQGAFATDVAPEPEGGLLALLRRAGGAEECRVGRDGRATRRPIAAPPPDPAAPAFFLERRCVDARRIDAADGAVLGWLAYPGC